MHPNQRAGRAGQGRRRCREAGSLEGGGDGALRFSKRRAGCGPLRRPCFGVASFVEREDIGCLTPIPAVPPTATRMAQKGVGFRMPAGRELFTGAAAARLQTLAEPGAVVIAAGTRRH
jgi:hypothetical protein